MKRNSFFIRTMGNSASIGQPISEQVSRAFWKLLGILISKGTGLIKHQDCDASRQVRSWNRPKKYFESRITTSFSLPVYIDAEPNEINGFLPISDVAPLSVVIRLRLP